MTLRCRLRDLFSIPVVLVVTPMLLGDEATKRSSKPAATTANEPMAKVLSLAKSGEYLDAVTVAWTKANGAEPHQGPRRQWVAVGFDTPEGPTT